MNAKKPIIRSIYRFHVYYHIRKILKILEIPLPYENTQVTYGKGLLINMQKLVLGAYLPDFTS